MKFFLRKSSSRINYFCSDYLIEFAMMKNQYKFDVITRIEIIINLPEYFSLKLKIFMHQTFYSDSTKILNFYDDIIFTP